MCIFWFSQFSLSLSLSPLDFVHTWTAKFSSFHSERKKVGVYESGMCCAESDISCVFVGNRSSNRSPILRLYAQASCRRFLTLDSVQFSSWSLRLISEFPGDFWVFLFIFSLKALNVSPTRLIKLSSKRKIKKKKTIQTTAHNSRIKCFTNFSYVLVIIKSHRIFWFFRRQSLMFLLLSKCKRVVCMCIVVYDLKDL